MKIVLITNMTPASENIRGTSALPYHLLAQRPNDVEVKVYSYNYNNLNSSKIEEAEKKLDVEIRLLKQPSWPNWIRMFKLGVIFRVFLRFPLPNYIRINKKDLELIELESYDGVWVYGEEMSRIVRQFHDRKCVHTLPDCESLYYYRMLGERFVFKNPLKFWACTLMYPKFLRMERNFEVSHNIHYHLVGDEDTKFLENICPEILAHFIRHPHYEVAELKKTISFSQPRIKVLIAGQNNLYMRQDADLIIKDLMVKDNAELLKDFFSFTFLGKGWDMHVNGLCKAGYHVSHITFAPDYVEEISKHDIQITPICIGTGTKGKVLDALANGLLVIGSWYALENIMVESGVSCLQYKNVKEVVEYLKEIPKDIAKYEFIAERGRRAVFSLHNRASVSKEVFDLFRQ